MHVASFGKLGIFDEMEGQRVSDIQYSLAYIDNSVAVCETFPKESWRQARKLSDFSDDDLLYIRTALHRVASLRILNADDVDDIVQETMLTMTMKYPQEQLQKGLLVWSMGILRHKVGNYYRQARRCLSFHENTAPERDHFGGTFRGMSPENIAQYSELCCLLDAILTKFQPAERVVLNMHLEGMPAGEIAEAFHSEKYQNIINKIHRGRYKLARELVKHGYTDMKMSKKRSR